MTVNRISKMLLEISTEEYQFLEKLSEVAQESAEYCQDSYDNTFRELVNEILHQWRKNENHEIVLEEWVR